MRRGRTLAYLAGLVDGDGYFKVVRAFRTPGTVHPYYATIIGVAQLWPGEAVELFASTLGGAIMAPQRTPAGRLMARCEVQGPKAESAARRLLPFLLLKRNQALLLLEIARIRPHKHGRPRNTVVYDEMESVRQALQSVQSGSWRSEDQPPLSPHLKGYVGLSPEELGWSPEEMLEYLAGIIDSDGNLRVEKRRVKGMRGPHYRISIRCTQVDPSAAVELLAATFGGRCAFKKSTRPNSRDLVTWSLHDKSAARAVEALLPFLRVKPQEAQMLLELRGLKSRGKKGITSWTHVTRWHRPLRLRKLCYTPEQNAEFERIHRAVGLLHSPPTDTSESE